MALKCEVDVNILGHIFKYNPSHNGVKMVKREYITRFHSYIILAIMALKSICVGGLDKIHEYNPSHNGVKMLLRNKLLSIYISRIILAIMALKSKSNLDTLYSEMLIILAIMALKS